MRSKLSWIRIQGVGSRSGSTPSRTEKQNKKKYQAKKKENERDVVEFLSHVRRGEEISCSFTNSFIQELRSLKSIELNIGEGERGREGPLITNSTTAMLLKLDGNSKLVAHA